MLKLSPPEFFVATEIGANKLSSVIVISGVTEAPANITNLPLIYDNLPAQELSNPSSTPLPSAAILVIPFALYKSSLKVSVTPSEILCAEDKITRLPLLDITVGEPDIPVPVTV